MLLLQLTSAVSQALFFCRIFFYLQCEQCPSDLYVGLLGASLFFSLQYSVVMMTDSNSCSFSVVAGVMMIQSLFWFMFRLSHILCHKVSRIYMAFLILLTIPQSQFEVQYPSSKYSYFPLIPLSSINSYQWSWQGCPSFLNTQHTDTLTTLCCSEETEKNDSNFLILLKPPPLFLSIRSV